MSQTILIPLDLDQPAVLDSVFAAINNIVGTESARLILLTVIPQAEVGDFPYVGTEYVKKLGESAQNQLRRIGADRLGDTLEWQVDVRVGPVARTIVRRADHFDADLIVMASHNPVFLDILLGSTARDVVKHARRSVLIVRLAEAEAAPAFDEVSHDALAD